ncbi:transposase [Patescibacteria group bacterium]|nr:transposase [Patescibacteria group bacterium]
MADRYLRRNFKPKTYHHIFNRGCFKQKIYRKKKDYEVFIDILKYYLHYPALSPLSKLSATKLKGVKQPTLPYQLLAYCLMPNHFHLLLKQVEAAPTLSDFLKKISITYAMYFQHQYHHSGALFQGKFKSAQVYPDEGLLYVSKYIHLNPKELEGSDPSDYPYSSLRDYFNGTSKDWLHPEIIFQLYFPKASRPQLQYRNYVQIPSNPEKETILRKMEGSDPSD